MKKRLTELVGPGEGLGQVMVTRMHAGERDLFESELFTGAFCL
jgi:hypothetical protein